MRKAIAVSFVLALAGGIASCKPAAGPATTTEPSSASTPAPAPAADWVVFEATPDATIYIDPASIQRQGDRAEMWALIDYKSPQPDKTGKQVLSDKLQYQYDCKGKQASIVATSAHGGPMATGETVSVNPDPPEVQPVPADTTAERMWQRACGESAAT